MRPYTHPLAKKKQVICISLNFLAELVGILYFQKRKLIVDLAKESFSSLVAKIKSCQNGTLSVSLKFGEKNFVGLGIETSSFPTKVRLIIEKSSKFLFGEEATSNRQNLKLSVKLAKPERVSEIILTFMQYAVEINNLTEAISKFQAFQEVSLSLIQQQTAQSYSLSSKTR